MAPKPPRNSFKQPSIKAGWESYRGMVLHPATPEHQLADLRLAFYAGASVLFNSLIDALDPGAEPTADDFRRMDGIAKEIETFSSTFDGEAYARLNRAPTMTELDEMRMLMGTLADMYAQAVGPGGPNGVVARARAILGR